MKSQNFFKISKKWKIGGYEECDDSSHLCECMKKMGISYYLLENPKKNPNENEIWT